MGDNVNNYGSRTQIDTNLPFFTYGIFKPGEIAYSNIKKFIDDKNPNKIRYSMIYRDGLPILLNNKNEGLVNGYIYTFNNNKKAYGIINRTISKNLYEWGIVNTDIGKANALFGIDPNLGSDDYNCSELDIENYTGREDPIFKKVQLMKNDFESQDFISQKNFFELQGDYMFVWSALERYCKLKYNKGSDSKNRKELLKEDLFKIAISNFTDEENYRKIFTSDNLVERAFDKSKLDYCLNYFYTIRCNVVHGGKTDSGRDIGLLKQSISDLLNIVNYILEETFNEE